MWQNEYVCYSFTNTVSSRLFGNLTRFSRKFAKLGSLLWTLYTEPVSRIVIHTLAQYRATFDRICRLYLQMVQGQPSLSLVSFLLFGRLLMPPVWIWTSYLCLLCIWRDTGAKSCFARLVCEWCEALVNLLAIFSNQVLSLLWSTR